MDVLAIDKVVPCGLSIGGLIVLKFAIDHPDRVAGLILTCTGARIGTRHDWEARIATVRSNGLGVLGEATMERWFSPAFRAAAPEVVDGMRAMLERQPVSGYAALCALLRDTDLTAETGADRRAGAGDRRQPRPIDTARAPQGDASAA